MCVFILWFTMSWTYTQSCCSKESLTLVNTINFHWFYMKQLYRGLHKLYYNDYRLIKLKWNFKLGLLFFQYRLLKTSVETVMRPDSVVTAQLTRVMLLYTLTVVWTDPGSIQSTWPQTIDTPTSVQSMNGRCCI